MGYGRVDYGWIRGDTVKGQVRLVNSEGSVRWSVDAVGYEWIGRDGNIKVVRVNYAYSVLVIAVGLDCFVLFVVQARDREVFNVYDV